MGGARGLWVGHPWKLFYSIWPDVDQIATLQVCEVWENLCVYVCVCFDGLGSENQIKIKRATYLKVCKYQAGGTRVG